MAVDQRPPNAWAALVKAATAYTKKNGSQPSQTDPKAKSREILDKALGYGRELAIASYNRLPNNWKGLLQGEAFKLPVSYGVNPYISTDPRLNKIIQTQAEFLNKAKSFAWGMPPPQTPEPTQETSGRGQIRVDLDTSPVQTKDSVMYRNAGEGEESTIGEASRPNKRKPGLSSNLGINL